MKIKCCLLFAVVLVLVNSSIYATGVGFTTSSGSDKRADEKLDKDKKQSKLPRKSSYQLAQERKKKNCEEMFADEGGAIESFAMQMNACLDNDVLKVIHDNRFHNPPVVYKSDYISCLKRVMPFRKQYSDIYKYCAVADFSDNINDEYFRGCVNNMFDLVGKQFVASYDFCSNFYEDSYDPSRGSSTKYLKKTTSSRWFNNCFNKLTDSKTLNVDLEVVVKICPYKNQAKEVNSVDYDDCLEDKFVKNKFPGNRGILLCSDTKKLAEAKRLQVCISDLGKTGLKSHLTNTCSWLDRKGFDPDFSDHKIKSCIKQGLSAAYRDYYELKSWDSKNPPYKFLIKDCTKNRYSSGEGSKNMRVIADLNIHTKEVFKGSRGDSKSVRIGGFSGLKYRMVKEGDQYKHKLYVISDVKGFQDYRGKYHEAEPRIYVYNMDFDYQKGTMALKEDRFISLTKDSKHRSHSSSSVDNEGFEILENGDFVISSEAKQYDSLFMINRYTPEGKWKSAIPLNKSFQYDVEKEEKYCVDVSYYGKCVKKKKYRKKKDKDEEKSRAGFTSWSGSGSSVGSSSGDKFKPPNSSGSKNDRAPVKSKQQKMNVYDFGDNTLQYKGGSASNSSRKREEKDGYRMVAQSWSSSSSSSSSTFDSHGCNKKTEKWKTQKVERKYMKDIFYASRGFQFNKGVESVSASPSNDFLFTINEDVLIQDTKKERFYIRGGCNNTHYGSGGSYSYSGSKSRYLRLTQYELKDNEYSPIAEYKYKKEDEIENGVSDILALNDTQVLVLERSWDGKNITARIYLVDIKKQKDISEIKHLAGVRKPESLKKELILDLGHVEHQLSPGFRKWENVEGMALGPVLVDDKGDRTPTLIMVTDNNFKKVQRTVFILFEITSKKIKRALGY